MATRIVEEARHPHPNVGTSTGNAESILEASTRHIRGMRDLLADPDDYSGDDEPLDVIKRASESVRVALLPGIAATNRLLWTALTYAGGEADDDTIADVVYMLAELTLLAEQLNEIHDGAVYQLAKCKEAT